MTSPEPPRILCAGISVLDEVFRVEDFPAADGKAHGLDYTRISGGCAANAAITVARLGGQAKFAGPLGGPPGQEPASDLILATLRREGVDCSACVRVEGAVSAISAIFVNTRGDRSIVTYRDKRLDGVRPDAPEHLVAGVDAVLADNRFADFTLPICQAARRRGLDVVLDVDAPTTLSHPLLAAGSHVIFSAEALRVTSGLDDLAAALKRARSTVAGFLAVTNGAEPVLWCDGEAIRSLPVFTVDVVETLAAGDVYHGAFALALAERRDLVTAMQFAAAAAGLKCTRCSGSSAIPTRTEVESFLARRRPPIVTR